MHHTKPFLLRAQSSRESESVLLEGGWESGFRKEKPSRWLHHSLDWSLRTQNTVLCPAARGPSCGSWLETQALSPRVLLNQNVDFNEIFRELYRVRNSLLYGAQDPI